MDDCILIQTCDDEGTAGTGSLIVGDFDLIFLVFISGVALLVLEVGWAFAPLLDPDDLDDAKTKNCYGYNSGKIGYTEL